MSNDPISREEAISAVYSVLSGIVAQEISDKLRALPAAAPLQDKGDVVSRAEVVAECERYLEILKGRTDDRRDGAFVAISRLTKNIRALPAPVSDRLKELEDALGGMVAAFDGEGYGDKSIIDETRRCALLVALQALGWQRPTVPPKEAEGKD